MKVKPDDEDACLDIWTHCRDGQYLYLLNSAQALSSGVAESRQKSSISRDISVYSNASQFAPHGRLLIRSGARCEMRVVATGSRIKVGNDKCGTTCHFLLALDLPFSLGRKRM